MSRVASGCLLMRDNGILKQTQIWDTQLRQLKLRLFFLLQITYNRQEIMFRVDRLYSIMIVTREVTGQWQQYPDDFFIACMIYSKKKKYSRAIVCMENRFLKPTSVRSQDQPESPWQGISLGSQGEHFFRQLHFICIKFSVNCQLRIIAQDQRCVI